MTQAALDLIFNGKAVGTVAERLLKNNMDVRMMRPWVGEDGRSFVSQVRNGKPTAVVTNAVATLRKDEWKQLDEAVVKAALSRLRFVSDLEAAGLIYSIPNGMGKTVLETETQSDVNDAIISMDAARRSLNDRPEYELTSLPLPIVSKDFGFSARQLAVSRNGGSPLDTTMAELAGRKVGEMLEKLFLGTAGAFSYGGGTVYGLTTFAGLTKVITSPAAGGWTPAAMVNEVMAMKLQSQGAKHYGPWMLYANNAWDAYLDRDYSSSYPNLTLRDRLKKIDGIQDVRTLDYLTTDYDLILVQFTSDVVRMVKGMELTNVQWETEGGMLLNYKVMAIKVPQFRADFNGNTGLVYGAVA